MTSEFPFEFADSGGQARHRNISFSSFRLHWFTADLRISMKEHVTIVRATHADSLDIWRWRNDAHTRAMSVDTAELDLSTHAAWFEDSLENSRRYLFIGTWQGEKIGVCRFDLDPARKVANVSINLNPQMRGRSLSRPLLSAAIAAFRRACQADLTATIKPENEASIRCFARCGFVFEFADTQLHHYRLTGNQRTG